MRPRLFVRSKQSALFHLQLALATPVLFGLSLLVYFVYAIIAYTAVLPAVIVFSLGLGSVLLCVSWVIDLVLLTGVLVMLPLNIVWGLCYCCFDQRDSYYAIDL